jgi:hypothetical protein
MENEEARNRTLDLLDSWAGIGVFGRFVVMLAIIAALGWLAVQCLTLLAWLALTLA